MKFRVTAVREFDLSPESYFITEADAKDIGIEGILEFIKYDWCDFIGNMEEVTITGEFLDGEGNKIDDFE